MSNPQLPPRFWVGTDELDVHRLFAETPNAFGGIEVVGDAVGIPVTAAPRGRGRPRPGRCTMPDQHRGTWLANRETAGPDGGGDAIIKLTGFVLGSPCPGYSAL